MDLQKDGDAAVQHRVLEPARDIDMQAVAKEAQGGVEDQKARVSRELSSAAASAAS